MDDFGLKIGDTNIDARNADSKDLILSSQYPFAKMDRTNEVSFQNVRLTFVNNPPEPVAPNYDDVKTLVHQFPHGYDYTPAVWSLFQVESTPSPNFQRYSLNGGLISQTTAFDAAFVVIEADDTNVNIFVIKNKASIGSNNDITGAIIRLRVYVFVEDVGVA